MIESSAIQQAISYGGKGLLVGTLYSISHSFWLGIPAAQATRNIIITLPVFAAIGSSYQLTTSLCANLRHQNDSFNQATGGFIAGIIAGFSKNSTQKGIIYGSVLAATAYFVTELLDTHYSRQYCTIDREDGRKLPNFLVDEYDPFSSRISKQM